MSLKLKPCFQETCTGLRYIDKTGPYSEEDNPGGYGPENGVESPQDFDGGYTISLWLPGQSASNPPQVVLDLLPAPEPDGNGFYTWDFSFADLGVDVIPSGFGRAEVVGINLGQEYTATVGPLFTLQTQKKVDQAMKKYDPACPGKKGCQDPGEFFMMLTTVQCNGVCDGQKAESILKYIDNNIKNCC